jgi:hypothetical protein
MIDGWTTCRVQLPALLGLVVAVPLEQLLDCPVDSSVQQLL